MLTNDEVPRDDATALKHFDVSKTELRLLMLLNHIRANNHLIYLVTLIREQPV